MSRTCTLFSASALDIIPDQCLLYCDCDILKGLLSLLFLTTTIYICMNTSWLFVENTSCYDIVYLKMDFLSVNSSKHGGGMTDTHTRIQSQDQLLFSLVPNVPMLIERHASWADINTLVSDICLPVTPHGQDQTPLIRFIRVARAV